MLSSLAVMLAHTIFACASDYAERMASFGRSEARSANARRFLTAAIGSVEVGTGPATQFEGAPHQVEFTTSAPTLDGQRRLDIRMTGDTIVAERGRWPAASEAEVDSVCFDYLLDIGVNALWSREWRSSVTAPIAVRLRIWRRGLEADTILVAVGVRG